jgi:hypothetical protein
MGLDLMGYVAHDTAHCERVPRPPLKLGKEAGIKADRSPVDPSLSATSVAVGRAPRSI